MTMRKGYTMTTTIPATAALKAQARRLRNALGARGQTLSHSAALELVAQTHGMADWNTAAALSPAGQALQPHTVGEPVRGHYLGQPFTGRVHALRRKGAAHMEIEIQLDQPVNVSRSALFEAPRRRIRATIGPEGRSIGATSDGVPHLQIAAA